jgi:transcription elongation factor GreB
MSRAFLKESTLEEPEIRPRGLSGLPPGAKNLLTPRGARRLRSELDQLLKQRAAYSADRSEEDKREIMLLDERIRPLNAALATAEIVPPPSLSDTNQVKFGAAVTVRDPQGRHSDYRLVGLAESHPEEGDISYLSPLAQALLNARLGEKVPFRFPKGQSQLEIVAIAY